MIGYYFPSSYPICCIRPLPVRRMTQVIAIGLYLKCYSWSWQNLCSDCIAFRITCLACYIFKHIFSFLNCFRANAGIKDASDKKILVDMLFWAIDNPPPANYLLISGDRDFSNAIHKLKMRRYNILLAQPPNVSQTLTAAAKSVWLWKSLVAGEPPLAQSP